jgi:nitronate monooxygenase
MAPRTPSAPADLAALLGVEHPIVLAPMAGSASTPELVAAVSNAGGLGSIGAAYLSPEEIAAEVAAVRRLTSRPFAVNLFAGGRAAGAPDPGAVAAMTALLARYHDALGVSAPAAPAAQPDPFPAQLDAVLAARVPAFSFTFGVPDAAALAALRRQGVVVMGTATSVAEARALDAAGVDAVVAQGSEAGAHRGTFIGAFEAALVGTMALVPQVADAVAVPVIAAGGIMDGRGVAAARALGAAGVQLGTAFLTADESGVPEAHKAAVLAARDTGTAVTRAYSGRHGRGIVNRLMAEIEGSGVPIPPFPVQQSLTRAVRAAAAARGETALMQLWAGQGAPMARRRPAAEIVADLVRESAAVIRALAAAAR